MERKNLYAFLVVTGVIILSALSVSAQQSTDSILEFARKQIYENPNLAIETAEELFNTKTESTDIKVRSLIIISTAYSSKREYEKSLEYSRKALEMLPQITDIVLKINLLNRIGGQYQELNVYDKALTYLDQAFKLIATLPESAEKLRSLGFNNLVRGFIYREQMSCEIALDYFNSSIDAYKKLVNQSQVFSNLSIAYYNKGNCLLYLNRINDAEDSYLLSITNAEKINAKSLVAFAKKGLANVYTVKGNHEKAVNLLSEALENAEEVGDKILNRSIYSALANNYLELADFQNYALFQQKNESIHNEIIQTERKTIDNSIFNFMKTNATKVEAFKNRNMLIKAGLVFFIIIGMLLNFRLIFSSEKTLHSLRKKLKF